MSHVYCPGENGEQDLLQHSLLAGSCGNSFRSIKMLVITISRHATFVCVVGVYEQSLDKRTTMWPRNMLPIRVIRNIAPLEWLHVTRLHSCKNSFNLCSRVISRSPLLLGDCNKSLSSGFVVPKTD
jgi:hypothetical protein